MGIRCLVLESGDSLRATGFGFMAWPNAWKALDALGIGDALRQQHIRLEGFDLDLHVFVLLDRQRDVVNHFHSGYDEVRCMKRKELIESLSSELPDGTIRFSSKLVSIQDSDHHLKILHLADGTIIKAKVLIGCDGVNSIVAKWLGFAKPAYTSRSSIRGYAHFESGHGFVHKGFQFHGNGIRVGYNPCDANTAYWFFTWTPSSEGYKDIQNDPEKAKKFVMSTIGNVTSEMKDVISKTGSRTYASPLRFRYPWELVYGNISKDNVCIAGDALHPMTSDVGQGANMALEDGVILARCIAQALKKQDDEEEEEGSIDELERIRIGLRKFGEERRWRSFGVITAAYVIGYIQQSNWWVMKFVKDKLLSPFLGKLLLKNADFDCGQLKI
ncbi:Monooxygenase 3 [Linum perenne]